MLFQSAPYQDFNDLCYTKNMLFCKWQKIHIDAVEIGNDFTNLHRLQTEKKRGMTTSN